MNIHETPMILFIGPDASRHRRLRTQLRRRRAVVHWAPEPVDREPAPDVVVADAADRGPQTLAELRRRFPDAWLLLERPFRDPGVESAATRVAWISPRSEPTLERRLDEILEGRLDAPPAPGPAAFVLCVDDDPRLLDSLQRLLTRSGYRVGAFTDPARALDSAAGRRPDLAIVDVMMPGMSGLKLAEEILAAHDGRVPVVLLSARGERWDIAEGYRHGAAYYLTKPCAPRSVLNIVDYLVGDLDRPERELIESELEEIRP